MRILGLLLGLLLCFVPSFSYSAGTTEAKTGIDKTYRLPAVDPSMDSSTDAAYGSYLVSEILALTEKSDVGLTYVDNVKHNFGVSAGAPPSTADSGIGYSVGSLWVSSDTAYLYYCIDATIGAAVWARVYAADTVDTLLDAKAASDHDHSGIYIEAESDSVVGAITGIIKADGAGNISAAAAGTDYLTPTGDGSSLTGITLGDNPDLTGSEGVNIPGGTTGERPASGTYGDLRYNSTLGVVEWFGTGWLSLLDGDSIGSSVQAYSANLTEYATTDPSANGLALVSAADYAAMRTLLGQIDLTTDVTGLLPEANIHSDITRDSELGTAGVLDTGTSIGDVIVWADVGTCSDPTYTTQSTCEGATETWTSAVGLNIGPVIDASGFNGNLATTDDTVQELAQKVDDLSVSGGTWGGITGTLADQADLQAALDLKAPLASPALTGTPTAPTPTASDNSTKIATTAYVDAAVVAGATGFVSAPTYSDDTCTAGQFAADADYFYICKSNNLWDRTALLTWSNPAPTPPTFVSGTIGTGGATTDITFSEECSFTSYSQDLTMTCATANGGSPFYLLSPTPDVGTPEQVNFAHFDDSIGTNPITVYSDDTCTITFGGAADSIEDLDGADLAAFGPSAVTNGSTEARPTVTGTAIDTTGLIWTLTTSEAVTAGAGGTGGMAAACTTAGAVTLTYDSGDTTSSLVYDGSPVVNADDTCTLAYTQPGDGWEDSGGAEMLTFSGAAVTNGSTAGGSACSTQSVLASQPENTLSFSATLYGVDRAVGNSFLSDGSSIYSVSVEIDILSGAGGNVYISVDDDLDFSDALYSSETVNVTSSGVVEFVFDPPPTTTSGTWYFIVYAPGVSYTNRMQLKYNTFTDYTDGVLISTTTGISNVVTSGSDSDLYFTVKKCD